MQIIHVLLNRRLFQAALIFVIETKVVIFLNKELAEVDVGASFVDVGLHLADGEGLIEEEVGREQIIFVCLLSVIGEMVERRVEGVLLLRDLL